MKFNPNKTPVEAIKEGSFGGTYNLALLTDGIMTLRKSLVIINNNVLPDMMLLGAQCKKVGLIALVHMGGFNFILNIGWEDKLKDQKV